MFHLYIFFSNGFHWGKFISPVLARFKRVFFVRTKKRTNTLKGTGERKPPPSRVGLRNMNDRLFTSTVCMYRESLTSMGRPHCGLPPIRATRFAQTSATANAIIHISLPAGTGQLKMGGELNGILMFAGMKRGLRYGDFEYQQAHEYRRFFRNVRHLDRS